MHVELRNEPQLPNRPGKTREDAGIGRRDEHVREDQRPDMIAATRVEGAALGGGSKEVGKRVEGAYSRNRKEAE